MTPEEISQLRRHAFHLREMVAREERLGSPRTRLPSWTETKRMLLNWADELDQEAKEAERAQN
jgi:hypothetical protein